MAEYPAAIDTTSRATCLLFSSSLFPFLFPKATRKQTLLMPKLGNNVYVCVCDKVPKNPWAESFCIWVLLTCDWSLVSPIYKCPSNSLLTAVGGIKGKSFWRAEASPHHHPICFFPSFFLFSSYSDSELDHFRSSVDSLQLTTPLACIAEARFHENAHTFLERSSLLQRTGCSAG